MAWNPSSEGWDIFYLELRYREQFRKRFNFMLFLIPNGNTYEGPNVQRFNS